MHISLARSAVLIVLVFLFALSRVAAQDQVYSADVLVAMYESGQFRVIRTLDRPREVSPNHEYVRSDGTIYRLHDGMRILEFETYVTFSPDGRYVVHYADGFYRLSDGQKIGETEAGVIFSPDNQYAAGLGRGVYRLSDGALIIESGGEIQFSPDSQYVVTGEHGLFRLSDQQPLFYVGSYFPKFSSDGQYVYAIEDSIYRVADGTRLIAATDDVRFTDDGRYVLSRGNVYRLEDGQLLFEYSSYPYEEISGQDDYLVVGDTSVHYLYDSDSFSHGLDGAFSPDGSLFARAGDGVYNIEGGQRLFEGIYRLSREDYLFSLPENDDGRMHIGITSPPEFSPNGNFIMLDRVGIFRATDGQQIFAFSGTAMFSPDERYVIINDTLYRMEDGASVIEFDTSLSNHYRFSTDSQYIQANHETFGARGGGQDVLYRLHDGRSFEGLRFLDVEAGIMAIGNTILVADESQANQRIQMVYLPLRDERYSIYGDPHVNAARISAPYPGEYLAILAEANGWYQVGYDSRIGWIDGADLLVVSLPQ